jgi:L-threonylcarbamoyladenylate synthase
MTATTTPIDVTAAVAALRRRSLVVFPAESLYGIAADAGSPEALAHLVAVRGREAGKPILVLASDLGMVETLVRSVSPAARRLARRFWPGPLTLVLPARRSVPALLTGGTGTIGVRVPGSAVARALACRLGVPVTGPSANPPGAPPPRTALEARHYFGDAIAHYLDGGTLAGEASTVVAVEEDDVRVLRPGAIAESLIRDVLEAA